MSEAQHIRELGCLGGLKYPPQSHWPEPDRCAFDAAFQQGDVFEDEAGAAARWSCGTRRHAASGYGRWLAYLRDHVAGALDEPPIERLMRERVRAFIAVLREEVRLSTAASIVDGLYQTARIMAPDCDWDWLRRFQRRLQNEAEPLNRHPALTPTPETYAFGIELMKRAKAAPSVTHLLNEITYRNGLVIALLSIWPIRRRSLASLTVDRHLISSVAGLTLCLYPEDTKSKREEAFGVPSELRPFVEHYLGHVRPRLMRAGHSRAHDHNAFWVSQRGTRLTADRLYASVRREITGAFDKPMGLHDFRRSAATTFAIERPELAKLIPGVLQHSTMDVADRHYKLAGSARAARRYAKSISELQEEAVPKDDYWKIDQHPPK
jgi:integrase/recombinase XerD